MWLLGYLALPVHCLVGSAGLEPAQPFGLLHLKQATLPFVHEPMMVRQGEVESPMSCEGPLGPEPSESAVPLLTHEMVSPAGVEPATLL